MNAPAWRQGRRIPQNVYRNDVIAGQFQQSMWAAEAVAALEERALLRSLLSELIWYIPTQARGEAWDKARTLLDVGGRE